MTLPIVIYITQGTVTTRDEKKKKQKLADERSSLTSSVMSETDVLLEETTEEERDMEESGLQGPAAKKTQAYPDAASLLVD